jgi:hypothetical protein
MSKNASFRVSNESSQAERRTTLQNDRRIARERNVGTFHEFATGDDSGDGRFAGQTSRHVVGSTPVPQYSAGPSWADDPTGIEPSLNYAIGEQPAVGEPHEIEKSLRESSDGEGVIPTAPSNGSRLRSAAAPCLVSRPRRRSPTVIPTTTRKRRRIDHHGQKSPRDEPQRSLASPASRATGGRAAACGLAPRRASTITCRSALSLAGPSRHRIAATTNPEGGAKFERVLHVAEPAAGEPMMATVPIDADPKARAWRQRMAYVGLDENTPMLTPRAGAGVGIGPTISGHEVNPSPRPKPPAGHMRSERPAPPRTAAERVWRDQNVRSNY